MAYLEQTAPLDRAKAAIGVVGIHAFIGATLIAGLAVTVLPEEPRGTIEGRQIDLPPPPPPPPDPVKKTQKDQDVPVIETVIFVPEPVIAPFQPTPIIPTGDTPMDDGETSFTAGNKAVIGGMGDGLDTLPPPPPQADPSSALTPKPAQPRNNPGGWITQRDYRPNWINRDMAGTARFRLSVSSNGKIQDCQITRSSGHSALDRATCQLLRRRAKFEAARDSEGNRTGGSYASSVKWELPE